jgi:methylation protein EvaC
MSIYKQIEEYRHYDVCRFCQYDINTVINLGHVPLAGGFLKSKELFLKEKLFPLTIAFCENCYLLQVREVVAADKLFKDYFYHSSAIKTLVDHFEKIVRDFKTQNNNPSDKLIVEIGCNDGTFIKEGLRQGFKVVGVDPADNIVKPLIKEGLPIINEYFTTKTAAKIVKEYGQADLIFSSNTLAHIEDMHEVYRGINSTLKDDGILIFENHYLGNLIKEMQYDMIYHEHQYYYSLSAIVNFLKQHDLEVFNVLLIPIHAGSIRFYVQKKGGKRKIENIVAEMLKKEKKNGLTKRKIFVDYNKKIEKTKQDLLLLLHSLKKNNKTIAGYGASGRGTILSNYCGLTNDLLDYIIDDAPAKQGAYTPGNHLKIVPSDILSTKNKPDYVVLFAWSFWEEIKRKNEKYIKSGGKFIVPLPQVKVI